MPRRAQHHTGPALDPEAATLGEYRLLRQLGRGEMGRIVLAHDTALDRLVAIKFLATHLTGGRARERFLVEARAAARLSHPNVVAMHRVATSSDGELYIVSEYVDGCSLDRLPRPIAPDRLLELAIDIASGLAGAHRQGVLHRDVKPANAIVTYRAHEPGAGGRTRADHATDGRDARVPDGPVKLCDFGLAKLLDDGEDGGTAAKGLRASEGLAGVRSGTQTSDPLDDIELAALAGPLTQRGARLGTPFYMAPELRRGEPASTRSDLYAFGALLYELCAGRPPLAHVPLATLFDGSAPAFTPLAVAAASVDPRLATIAMRALAEDPQARFGSADELREALEALRPRRLPAPPPGTGKELVAQTFHRAGPHARGPFVAVNCAAIPESVAERLLFGAVRGAYSGASADAAGYVAAAEDGTLFLDEVGELHAAVQAKLLRVLEPGELMPLGAARARQCSTQFCFATLRNLRERAADGSFRADLFYRLERAHLVVPPLRARREEIPWLIALELGRHAPGLTVHPRLVEACLLRPWPGNVRELLLAVGRAAEQALAAGTTVVHPRHLDEAAGQSVATTGTLPRVRLDDLSSADVRAVIERHQGNLSAVARELGVHRSLLYRALDRLGIKR